MSKVKIPAPNDVSLVFSAGAGLGLQTAEDLSRQMLSRAGYYVFSTREYMSRVRGGNNSTQIRVANSPVRAATAGTDFLFALSPELRDNVTERITADTRIFGDRAVIGEEISRLGFEMTDLNLSGRAAELGGAVYSSVIVAGFIAGIFALGESAGDDVFRQRFAAHPGVLDKNLLAFRQGYGMATAMTGGHPPIAPTDAARRETLFMDGNTAIALGAAAAGCNFVTAYPMSPGTGVFTFFARHAHELDSVVEQVEDEISAVNMAIGASYAGARSLVTTSGGGFALMTEGLSLAGITETPLVVHLAQRPGPATGLATRTEQADLELALYAGHGEFPRALYAPINVESAYRAAGAAFHTAQKYQTVAVVLTDQYLLDSGYDVALPNPDAIQAPIPPLPAPPDYKRYAFPQGAHVTSPFAVPGLGEAFVSFDSHEHTEDAHITENRAIRRRMVEKRLGKLDAMRQEALPPVLSTQAEGQTMVICWGSTYEPLKEAIERLGRADLVLVACEQVYPVSSEMRALMRTPGRKIFVEGNATGQFAKLLKLETGVAPSALILKYDGFPFTVEELALRLEGVLEGGKA